MTNLMKNFFAELVKSTTYTTKVSIVKTTLHDWLRDQVYSDPCFKIKLQEVVFMFINNQITNKQIYMLVSKIDESNKFKPYQINFLTVRLLSNCHMKQLLEKFIDDYDITDEDLSFIANFLVREIDEAYKLIPY
ncbi:AC75 [Parapoynx stagnalis nucleopolyhedrovirus]|uniref:AC75 n=1 Tax=Parapoynx stagnalis nucleopolyhedrovirus TaxID=2993413 RepID=A0A9E7YDN2_9ABAC|nr:AC75 [Parapoynx stagnalis nucleopolyhedrovirus]